MTHERFRGDTLNQRSRSARRSASQVGFGWLCGGELAHCASFHGFLCRTCGRRPTGGSAPRKLIRPRVRMLRISYKVFFGSAFVRGSSGRPVSLFVVAHPHKHPPPPAARAHLLATRLALGFSVGLQGQPPARTRRGVSRSTGIPPLGDRRAPGNRTATGGLIIPRDAAQRAAGTVVASLRVVRRHRGVKLSRQVRPRHQRRGSRFNARTPRRKGSHIDQAGVPVHAVHAVASS